MCLVPNTLPINHLLLFQMSPLTYNLTSKIVQGTSNSQREGDSVYLEALKIEGIIHSSVDSNAYKYRILVGYSEKNILQLLGPALV